jgi:hypothetical protein
LTPAQAPNQPGDPPFLLLQTFSRTKITKDDHSSRSAEKCHHISPYVQTTVTVTVGEIGWHPFLNDI